MATQVQEILQTYKDLQDIIAILGVDELTDEQKLTVGARPPHRALPLPAVPRGRGLHRPARASTCRSRETIRGFKEIVEGKHDDAARGRRSSWSAASTRPSRRPRSCRRPVSTADPGVGQRTASASGVRILTPEGAVFDDVAYMVIAPERARARSASCPATRRFIAFLRTGETRHQAARRHRAGLRHHRGLPLGRGGPGPDPGRAGRAGRRRSTGRPGRGRAASGPRTPWRAAGDDEVARVAAEAARRRAENRLEVADRS